MGFSWTAVKKMLTKTRYDPAVFIQSGFAIQVRMSLEKKTSVWFCRMCGETRKDSRVMADHCFMHLWDEEILNDPERGWRA